MSKAAAVLRGKEGRREVTSRPTSLHCVPIKGTIRGSGGNSKTCTRMDVVSRKERKQAGRPALCFSDKLRNPFAKRKKTRVAHSHSNMSFE
jgi:hypothetical protein